MPSGAKPEVPAGFSVELVASYIASPRAIRMAPNGDLFVADSAANAVRVFRVPPGSAKPTSAEVFASDLYRPFGIAFYPPGPNPQWVYVANSDGVVRFPYKNGDLTATGKAEKIVERIPWVHHWTRDIVFSPDGKRLLLTVGSGSNVALDMSPQPFVKGGLQTWINDKPLGATWDTEERRADVLSFDPDGKNEKVFATGLRNCVGITFQPATLHPWCVVNERDELGDNTPFEYATTVTGGYHSTDGLGIILAATKIRASRARDRTSRTRLLCPTCSCRLIPRHFRSYSIKATTSLRTTRAAPSSPYTVHGIVRCGRGTRLSGCCSTAPASRPAKDFMTGFVISDQQVWGAAPSASWSAGRFTFRHRGRQWNHLASYSSANRLRNSAVVYA